MTSLLCEKLRFKLEPVAVFFTDERPSETFQAKKGTRVCAVDGCMETDVWKRISGRFDEPAGR